MPRTKHLAKPGALTTPATSVKPKKSSVGAPSQHSQSSRKGKKAWRKNVNIEDVEEGLEEIRAEERVTGKSLQSTRDEELFVIDTKGDDKVRHILPKVSFAQLTSAKILAQRSAVPAVFSRSTSAGATAGQKRRSSVLSKDEKSRLMRIAKRPRRGPFNSILDPSEYKSGSSVVELSKAVKESGKYDMWNAGMEEQEESDELNYFKRKPVKPPSTSKPLRAQIQVPAVIPPPEGASYNPPADAHHQLLLAAHQAEEKRVKEVEKVAEVKEKMERARIAADVDMDKAEEQGLVPGMKLDLPGDNAEDEETGPEDENMPVKNMPQRKTKAQRKKAAALLAEKRALAQKVANRRRLALLQSIKSLRKSTDLRLAEQEAARIRRLEQRQERLKNGLAGQKLGKHKVPQSEIDVQLGEDLSENLRGLKPEGNLFRDRFLSLQQRAVIEPRVRVLPKKRKTKIVEYEKHAWKRFE